MVAVVIHHADAVDFALELKAAVYAAEFFQPRADVFRPNVQTNPYGDGRGGVENIVRSRNMQRKIAQSLRL